MASEPKEEAKPQAKRRVTRTPAGEVKVKSTIGLTVPLPGEGFTGALTIKVGHERLAKSSSAAEVAKAFKLVDDANEDELVRQMKKYLRLVKRAQKEIDRGDDPDATLDVGSARDRARKKLASPKKAKKRKKGK